ncbi:hypothetical protein H4218_004636 [Coemansia sp. IMI 209128]|nr:hypothetical protein H4218_004636 [Coemansia sp. IMI 209128]
MVRFGTNTQKSTEPAWQDVGANVLRMDSLYDASFHEWLKNEENVSIIASYLQRIANEYPMDRIINALRWLVSSWRVESTAVIVRHITADWAVPQAPPPKPAASAHFRLDLVPVPPPTAADPSMLSGEARRGVLVRELTKDWTCQQIAQLVGMLALTFWSERTYLEAFLRTLVSDWDFCRLSSFFSFISGQLGLDYRVKVAMLQDAARRNASRLSLKRARNSAGKQAGVAAGECDGSDSKRARVAPSPSASSSVSSSLLHGGNGADATPASSQQVPSALHSNSQPATIATTNTSATTPLAPSSNPTTTTAPTAAATTAVAGGGAPMSLSARAAQSGRMPAPLQTGRPTLPFASQTMPLPQPATGAVTTPSSPSSPALVGSSSPPLVSVEPLASEEMQMSSSTTDLASMPYAESSQQQQQQLLRRRSRNNTSGSAMGAPPSSAASTMDGEPRGEQASSSTIIARRPLTPQMSSSVFIVHAAARPSSPTLRRHHRHNLSCQHRDCPPQPLTPSHSSSSLSIMATPANADSASAGSSAGSLTMRSSICLATTPELSAQSPADANLTQPQQQQDFRSCNGGESDLGQFDGPASTRLALPLPSESSANAASMCGRTSATPYDVLGIVMAEPEHHLAGSSA